VGGYTPERIALRRAILMGFDVPAEIKVALQGQGAPATQLIPPEVPGHDPSLRAGVPFDPQTARALLDKFGYRDRDGDGFREQPDGATLTLTIGSSTSSEDRIREELWKRSMQDIGLRITFVKQKWPELVKMARLRKLPMWQVGLTGQVADSYLQLCYGPAAGDQNIGHFKNDEYDDLLRKSRRLAPGPRRPRAH